MADQPQSIGRYEVVSRLGQGGMGSLFLAKDPKIGRLLAIKLVRQEFDSPDARQRFAREAQSAGTLRHPNIVTIFDVDEHDHLPFIAMEYIDGETLGEIVRRKAQVPMSRRLQWIEDLCAGLAYAHRQGVIHRDIKPANLMVDTEGTLKILDFGLARRDASKFTQSHVIIGTPNYMSPEQIRGGALDTRSDIFSVGAVLYELLAYTEAFPGSVHTAMHKIVNEEPVPIETIVADLDPRLPRIIQRSLEKRPDDRYRDLTAMKAELAEVRNRLESVEAENQPTMPLGPKKTTPLPGASSRDGEVHSKRFGADRGSLQRRRDEQIGRKLDEARARLESGALDQARASCEDALVFDPDHPAALQLLAEIAVEVERRRVADLLAEARQAMARGQIDAAAARVNEALALRPDAAEAIEVRDAIEAAGREMDKARQVQETLRRGRARFAEGAYESATRIAGEVLALDPNNQAARDLRRRAQEKIEERERKTGIDQQAQDVVAAARALLEGGNRAGAIRRLQAFPHKHDLVTAFLATVKREKVEAAPPATPESLVGIDIDRAAAGPRIPTRKSRLPLVGAAAAVVIAGAIAANMMLNRPAIERQETPAPAPPAVPAPSDPAPSDPAPGTVATPPPASEPPAASTPAAAAPSPSAGTTPAAPAPSPPAPEAAAPDPAALKARREDEDDLSQAYQALVKGRIEVANKIAARLRARNPRNPRLRELLDTIDSAQRDEKGRIAAAALAAAEEERRRIAAANASATPPPTTTTKPEAAPPPTDPAFTVLPGGGFAATSEPPAPPLVSEMERPGIEATIRAYEKAVTSRDIRAISQVRRYTAQQAENWRKFVQNQREYKLTIDILGPPKVDGNMATIPVEETVTQVNQRGERFFQNPRKLQYKLQKIGGQWTLLPPGS